MATATAHVPVSKDEAEIRSLLESLYQAHHNKNPEGVAAPFAPGAPVYDLEPPLMHEGISVDRKRKWMAGWDTPIDLEPRDLTVKVSGDLAVVHGFLRMSGTQKSTGRPVSFWMRVTYMLERTKSGWRITHLHDSVPFYMDGSLRPAFDLEPASSR